MNRIRKGDDRVVLRAKIPEMAEIVAALCQLQEYSKFVYTKVHANALKYQNCSCKRHNPLTKMGGDEAALDDKENAEDYFDDCTELLLSILKVKVPGLIIKYESVTIDPLIEVEE